MDTKGIRIEHIMGIMVHVTRFSVAVSDNKADAILEEKTFKINPMGYKHFLAWLERIQIKLPHTLVCIVNTKKTAGPSLIEFLRSQKALVWEEDYLRVGWFMGVKFLDLVKTKEVCLYALRNKQQILRDL